MSSPAQYAPKPYSLDEGSVISHVRALFEFFLIVVEDLAFPKGAVVQVHNMAYKQWVKGSFEGQKGIFPQDFVKPLPRLQALYRHVAKKPDELNYKAGDVISVINSPSPMLADWGNLERNGHISNILPQRDRQSS